MQYSRNPADDIDDSVLSVKTCTIVSKANGAYPQPVFSFAENVTLQLLLSTLHHRVEVRTIDLNKRVGHVLLADGFDAECKHERSFIIRLAQKLAIKGEAQAIRHGAGRAVMNPCFPVNVIRCAWFRRVGAIALSYPGRWSVPTSSLTDSDRFSELASFSGFYDSILSNADSGKEGTLSSSWGAVQFVLESLFGGMLNSQMAQESCTSVELNVYKYYEIRSLVTQIICGGTSLGPGGDDDKDADQDDEADSDLTKEPLPADELGPSRPYHPELQIVDVSVLTHNQPSVLSAIVGNFPGTPPSAAAVRELGFKFIDMMSALEMRVFPTTQRVVHGSISSCTVLVDMFQVAWLHDFSYAGTGHALMDLARFEVRWAYVVHYVVHYVVLCSPM
jgi:hypothetical protein